MAITKEINILVKETGLDEVNKKVNKLETSVESLEDQQRSLVKSMGDSSQSVLDNGGAMGLLNDATGGLAMTVKDAVEASVLFTKSQKISSIQQAIYTTVVGTSTGAMKAFRIALVATGVGALIVGLGLLIANFDKVKKVVLNLVPGLAKVGEWFGKIKDAATDFIGVTSEAERALEKFDKASQKRSDELDRKLAENGSRYSESAKKKMAIDAKLQEDLRKHIYNEVALRKEAQIAKDNIDKENAKKAEDARKTEREKIKTENEKAESDRIKLEEENKKKREDIIKEEAQKAYDINQEAQQFLIDDQKAKDDALELREEKEAQAGANKIARIQGEYDAEKKAKDDKILLDSQVRDAKVDIANQTLSLISEIAGKGSKIGKSIAIAQATISGVEGVQNAFTTAQKSPITAVFPAYPFIQAGLAGAFSAIQIAKIAKGEKASGGSSGGVGGSAPQAPSFNLVQGTGRNQLAEGLQNQAPIKAYVVPTDVSTGQSMDRNIVKSASL